VIKTLPRVFRIARRGSRRAALRFSKPHGLILMYHRIASSPWDPWKMCVRREHFEQHLSVLSRKAEIVPLADIQNHLRTRRQGRPAVALTFDDGYADNLAMALPLLENYGAPATVFVATSWIDRGDPFWWDRLANIVQSFATVPKEIALQFGSKDLFWRQQSKHDEQTSLRKKLHSSLWSQLLALGDCDRNSALQELQNLADRDAPVDVDTRPMTGDELLRLATSPLIEIGAHSKNHCSLPDLEPADLFEEVAGSRKQCEQMTGIAPSSFAYPFGRWNDEVCDQVRSAGFSRACAGGDEPYWQGADPMLLPRMHVLDYDGESFGQRLRWAWLP